MILTTAAWRPGCPTSPQPTTTWATWDHQTTATWSQTHLPGIQGLGTEFRVVQWACQHWGATPYPPSLHPTFKTWLSCPSVLLGFILSGGIQDFTPNCCKSKNFKLLQAKYWQTRVQSQDSLTRRILKACILRWIGIMVNLPYNICSWDDNVKTSRGK